MFSLVQELVYLDKRVCHVDALIKCIKGERTALGLPNHIVGMTSEREEISLEA